MFFIHGLPKSIKSDNGPQFRQEFSNYCDHNGITHHRVTPRWPQANGEMERQNVSFLKRIKIAYSDSGQNYKVEIAKYMTAYRSIPHPSTGKSPAELMYGRKIRTKLPMLDSSISSDQSVIDRDAEYKGKSKSYFDNKNDACYTDVAPGDLVLMKREVINKADTPFYSQPVTVVSKVGSQVTVQCQDGRQFKRNITCFRPYVLPEVGIVGQEADDDPVTKPDDGAACPPYQDSDDTPEDFIGPETTTTDVDVQPQREGRDAPQPLRRSERISKMPKHFKDFIMAKK